MVNLTHLASGDLAKSLLRVMRKKAYRPAGMSQEDHEDELRSEFGTGDRHKHRCVGEDYCGALDCSRCYPGGCSDDEEDADEEDDDDQADDETKKESLEAFIDEVIKSVVETNEVVPLFNEILSASNIPSYASNMEAMNRVDRLYEEVTKRILPLVKPWYDENGTDHKGATWEQATKKPESQNTTADIYDGFMSDLDVFVFDRFDDYVNAVEKGKTQSQEKQQ